MALIFFITLEQTDLQVNLERHQNVINFIK